MENVQLFLDYANINSSARMSGYKLDYNLLLNDFLVSLDEGRFLTGAFAYVPKDPRSEHSADREIEDLANSGFLVTSKIGVISGNSYKCNFAVEMTMDIMRVATSNKPDIIVIVSGDGDFIPLVRELRKMGIRVEIASFYNSSSRELRQIASGFIDIDQYLNNQDDKTNDDDNLDQLTMISNYDEVVKNDN